MELPEIGENMLARRIVDFFRSATKSVTRSTKGGHRLLALTALTCVIVAATGGCCPPPVGPVERPVFVVSGENVFERSSRSAVHIVDLSSLKTSRSVKLPRSWVRSPAVDPMGRLWVGLSGDQDRAGKEVWVIEQSGRVRAKIEVGEAPEAGISFNGGRAYVCCRGTGFSGQVWVVDLESLKVEKVIDLGAGPYEYSFLTASAAGERYLVVAANHSPPPGKEGEGAFDLPYGEVFVIDCRSNEIVSRVDLGPGVAVWDIMPADGEAFYLINNAAFQWKMAFGDQGEGPGDIILFDPAKGVVKRNYEVGGFPFKAEFLREGVLLIYCRIWSSKYVDQRRALVELDIPSGRYRRADLPAGFCGTDMLTIDGKIYFVGSVPEGNSILPKESADGLYTIEAGEAGSIVPVRVVAIRDASAIAAAPRMR
ncbi:MAG: hypothetical protein IMW97_05885 [Firmicutes bacterium]|nr:hypothetical protein [Candidatus Fermentithermobacillaceae bacterium]